MDPRLHDIHIQRPIYVQIHLLNQKIYKRRTSRGDRFYEQVVRIRGPREEASAGQVLVNQGEGFLDGGEVGASGGHGEYVVYGVPFEGALVLRGGYDGTAARLVLR